MRIAIAGAGSVGRSIAGELTENGHQVMLIDRDTEAIKPHRIEAAEWVLADATTWEPGRAYDLALLAYLQLPTAERRAAVRNAFEALAPGGTLLLVAHDGEWTRRVVPTPQWAHAFAESLQIPGYDAAVVGYPQRMRDYNTRNKKHPDLR